MKKSLATFQLLFALCFSGFAQATVLSDCPLTSQYQSSGARNACWDILIYQDGSKYTGDWKDNKFDGEASWFGPTVTGMSVGGVTAKGMEKVFTISPMETEKQGFGNLMNMLGKYLRDG